MMTFTMTMRTRALDSHVNEDNDNNDDDYKNQGGRLGGGLREAVGGVGDKIQSR